MEAPQIIVTGGADGYRLWVDGDVVGEFSDSILAWNGRLRLVRVAERAAAELAEVLAKAAA